MDLPAVEETIAVSAFKPRSLALIERVAIGRIARLVLTKRGRPVAVLVPAQKPEVELHGALRDLMQPVGRGRPCPARRRHPCFGNHRMGGRHARA